MSASRGPVSGAYLGPKYKTKGFTRDFKQRPIKRLPQPCVKLVSVLKFYIKITLQLLLP
jgi:hypothetical protein